MTATDTDGKHPMPQVTREEMELKPCPFCGGRAQYKNSRGGEDSMLAWIECVKCGAETEAFEDAYAPRDQAIAAWNTRVAAPAREDVLDADSDLKAVLKMVLHLWGPEGANKVTTYALEQRALKPTPAGQNDSTAAIAAETQDDEAVKVYSSDEQRVCDYIQSLTTDVGCGDDPIGFLIASHNFLRQKQAAPSDGLSAELREACIAYVTAKDAAYEYGVNMPAQTPAPERYAKSYECDAALARMIAVAEKYGRIALDRAKDRTP